MSLINDALKKAQRERSGEHTPAQPPSASPPPPPSSPAHATPAAASSGFKAWPIVAAVAIVVAGFLGWRMFAPSKPADTVAATSESAPAAAAPATTAAQPEPQPVASASPSQPTETATTTTSAAPAPAAERPTDVATTTPAVAAPAVQTQPAPAPEPPPAVAVRIDEQPSVAVTIPSTAAAAPTTAPQELPATVITIPEGPVGASPAATLVALRQQDPRILAYLDALRVNGIRPSPDDPKALMNNRVFRIGDVVDRELNLRLTSIAPNKLGFEDDRGMPYLKSF